MGWLAGTVVYLLWGSGLDSLASSIALGMTVGIGVSTYLERRGKSTVSNDSALANAGVFLFFWMLGLGLIRFGFEFFSGAQSPPLSRLPALGYEEASLVFPLQMALAAAWFVKPRTQGAIPIFCLVMTLWSPLLLAQAAFLGRQQAHPLAATAWSTLFGWLLCLALASLKTRERIYSRTDLAAT